MGTWSSLRRNFWWYKRRCGVFNLCILLVILVLICLFRYTILCSEWQIRMAVKKLCQIYQEDQISGNMCHDLCINRTIKLGSCQTNHLAKEIVFEAEWNGEKIVIKSNFAELMQYDSIILPHSNQVQYPSVSEFTLMVANHVKYNLNISLGPPRTGASNILNKLWSLDFENYLQERGKSVLSAMNSIWSLVQQNEYVLMKLFEKQRVFPKIFGTCGHFYAMEFVYPLQLNSWPSRISYALQLLELSNKLESKFHQPLHLCDIKLNHFGLDNANHLKVIDVDTAYFESIINNIITSEKKCESNVDCSFWDCQSKCQTATKSCNKGVSNNNLQVICRKIFLGRISHSPALKSFETGLLVESAYSSPGTILRNLLEECAFPDEDSQLFSNSLTSTSLKSRLKLFLQAELNVTK